MTGDARTEHALGCWAQPGHERCALRFAAARAETRAAQATAEARLFRLANQRGPIDPTVVQKARDSLTDPSQPGPGKPKIRRGETSPRAKLTDAQVEEIRAAYWRSPNNARLGNGPELAARYGVSRQTIHLIVTGQRRFAA